MQVEEFLECSAARFPDKLALIAGSRRVTYRDLDCQANRLAYSLVELGVRRGDRVAIWMDNSVEAVVALFASLKAGGVGLNLSKADYVFLIDPWWNEAVEAQAIDRAHRIGRKDVVIAKRFVTIGTIEEKMLKLKQDKLQAQGDILDLDPEKLTGPELLSLIRSVS